MTPPRSVIENRTYMFTRRCANRHFFLRPSKKVNQAFVYCFAVAAHRATVTLQEVRGGLPAS